MVKPKRQSKRVSLKQKYKMERKVKEHHRKLRKEAKKAGAKKKWTKDPGIPNLFPFKEQLLQQISEEKRSILERKQQEKEARKRERNSSMTQLQQMQFDAQKRSNEYDTANKMLGITEEGSGHMTMRADAMSHAQRRAYFREFNKVMEESDVIIEVLDARDPLGCRAPDVERMILTKDPNKRIILLLNKIDLVPREIVERWLSVLRKELPAIAFKASTQKQGHISHASAATGSRHVGTSECLGADTLMQLLKNYSRSQQVKKSITVGIIGFPNVGKSSVINSLKRARVAAVGNTPGLTKTSQNVKLDSNINLIDSPGIIFSSASLDADVILRNAVKVEQIEDPTPAIDAVLNRCRREKLMELYSIPMFVNTNEFLALIARKRGYLRKAGVPDYVRAGRTILDDWNSGKIPFFTIPPDNAGLGLGGVSTSLSATEDSQIVAQYAKEFDIGALLGTLDAAVHTLKSVSDVGAQYVAMQPGKAGDAVLSEEQLEEESGSDDDDSDDDDDDSDDDVEMEDDDDDDDDDMDDDEEDDL
eukprot:ANDGO_08568.mRNA.1 Guanine nucleotide-binding protein-like 3 homolog